LATEIELKAIQAELLDQVLRCMEHMAESQWYCYFDIFSRLAAENGDCIDLQYAPVRKEGAKGYQVDGFALDAERGELYLAVCDFDPAEEIRSLNQSDITSLFGRVERFFENSLKAEFINSLEESSPAFQAAYPIFQHHAKIRRVRVIIFANARLAVRSKKVDSKELLGKTFTYNVLDLNRYYDIEKSQGNHEPIEIDIAELNGRPLPCLAAHTKSGSYQSYLAAVPGPLLAEIYGRYGARLLEQNVRSFLQARGKVNQGIIKTIHETPEMFFAYNNGLTATASDIKLEEGPDGVPGIKSLQDFQIVNGGQTTASVLYAKDNPPRGATATDLSRVFVQMKLSIVKPDLVEQVVPRISEYANTQNRISTADLFSNHPFHLEMEKISRRMVAPPRPGVMASSKWFYERARGQYKNARGTSNSPAARRFEAEFPPGQVVTKTDLAKVELTFMCLPGKVSLGAQKCFSEFADIVDKGWQNRAVDYNDAYFKSAVAKTLVFDWTDSMVGTADWYKDDRGYKANFVTYTIAWLVNHVREKYNSEIDLDLVWRTQSISDALANALQVIAPLVAARIKAAPGDVRNISEYAKRSNCWNDVKALAIDLPAGLQSILVDRGEVRQQQADARGVRQIDREIEFDQEVLGLVNKVGPLRAFAKEKRFISHKSDAVLTKLERGNINLTSSDKSVLKLLLKNAKDRGFEF